MRLHTYWRPYGQALILLAVLTVGVFVVLPSAEIAVMVGVGSLLLLSVLFMAVAVHEFGHLVAGRSLGLKLAAMKIGPFLWTDGNTNTDRHMWESVNGAVLMHVSDPKVAREQLRHLVRGGPLASLAFALVVSVAFLVFQASWPPTHSFGMSVYYIGLSILILSWAMLINVLPFQTKAGRSDGMMLMKLKPGERGERFAANCFIGTESLGDVRARDWSREVVESACSLSDGSEDEAMARYHAYAHFRDAGDLDRALSEIRRAVSIVLSKWSVNPRLKAAVLIEGAFASDDIVVSRAWLDEAAKLGQPFTTFYARAEASVLDREGRRDEARASLERFLGGVSSELKNMPNRLQASLDWTADLIDRYPI